MNTIKTASRIQAKKRLFSAVKETAADLRRLGFIDERKMAQYKAVCMDPTAATTTPTMSTRRARR